MINKLKKILSFLLLLLCTHTAFAQVGRSSPNASLQAWSGAGLQYKYSKEWSFQLEQQLRIGNGLELVEEYFTQLQADYTLRRWVKLQGGYRFIRNNDMRGKIQGYENYTRFNLDITTQHKFEGTWIKNRIRFQNKDEVGVSLSEGDPKNRILRYRFLLENKVPDWKFDPIMATEIFYRMRKGISDRFDKIRFTLGTDFKLTKTSKMSVFYYREYDLTYCLCNTQHIFNLNYTYLLK